MNNNNQPHGYAELEFPPGLQVECLHGQHRFLAAATVLELEDKQVVGSRSVPHRHGPPCYRACPLTDVLCMRVRFEALPCDYPLLTGAR